MEICLHQVFKDCDCTYDEMNKICPRYYPITLNIFEIEEAECTTVAIINRSLSTEFLKL